MLVGDNIRIFNKSLNQMQLKFDLFVNLRIKLNIRDSIRYMFNYKYFIIFIR